MIQGVDVSTHNGKVNWQKAKNTGLDFAMLRCGYGSNIKSQDDAQFERNVSECDRLGIPWGAYLYSYALTANDAKSELQHILRVMSGKKPTLPIFIDMEDADGYKKKHGGVPSKSVNTQIVKTVCNGLTEAGYMAGYYCNRDWYYNHLNTENLTQYEFWYARPGVSKPDLACDIWQNNFDTTGGSWPGANLSSGGCDTNVLYADYLSSKGPSKPQETIYAPDGSPYTSDTTATLGLAKGAQYQLEVQCSAGRPNVVAGNGSVVDVSFKSQIGDKYYFTLTGKGTVGESTGIYINGGKSPCFNTEMISAVQSDTTVDMKLEKGKCYTMLLRSTNKPTVTLGSSGIATVAGVFQNAPNKNEWLVPIVAWGVGKTGVYTQVNAEPAVKQFVLEGV